MSEQSDVSTNQVIDWLNLNNTPYLRINDISAVEIEHFEIGQDEFDFSYRGKVYSSASLYGYWLRRPSPINSNTNPNSLVEFAVNRTNKIERSVSIKFLLYKLENHSRIKAIGSFFNADINKLIQLDFAIRAGLIVPQSYLTKRKLDGRLVTKSLDQVSEEIGSDFYIMNYTNEIKKFPDEFGTSYLQRLIPKTFEIRTFYLEGTFYSMAIFSQENKQTQVDFRRYDNEKPNRLVPFCLPNELEEKICLLFKFLNLNCGSVDLILTDKNEFVFLEVNPVGQFGMLSHPCNYHIERFIANKLTEICHEKRAVKLH